MHFQFQKLMQFCFCLHRTAMRLRHCCMAARMFVSICKCSVVHICNEQCITRCQNHFHQSLTVTRVYFNIIIFFIVFELVFSCFGACCAWLQCIILIHVLYYTYSCTTCTATCAWSCFVQHATCKFAFSHDFECTNALCKFCKFCFVLFVPLLFALYCVVHAAFALLVDKAGVLCNCKFCSCNQANVFADVKCNYSPQ